ncbi:MAG: hypothetical protein R3197_16800 [Paracoccaceae bacterium]|nr:hypothetical protein [Paracoccaceae bacterium]
MSYFQRFSYCKVELPPLIVLRYSRMAGNFVALHHGFLRLCRKLTATSACRKKVSNLQVGLKACFRFIGHERQLKGKRWLSGTLSALARTAR